MLDNLWATVIVVLFLVSFSKALFTSPSVLASRSLVASSNNSIGASFKIALAIDIRCLCPPERFFPPSPKRVL